MSEPTLQEIELSMDLTKKKIRQAEVLKRLEENADFKEFILEGFCEKHALGLLQKRDAPAYQDKVNQKYIRSQITAVGALKLYMQFTRQEGDEAAASLKAHEDARAQLMAEEQEVA